MDLIGKVVKSDQNNQYICYEVPKRILTDQGREFTNTINTKVCGVLGIKRSLCAPYHPQTNGLVERLNGTIQRVLSKLVQDKPNTWDQYLDAAMFGLRTKKQLTTQFSPFYLMFGREARYPCEVPEHFELDGSFENDFTEDIAIDIKRHDKIMNIVKDNVNISIARTRKRLSKKAQFNLQVGAKVWRRNVRSEQRKGGKLDPEYFGPFVVTKIQGKSVDLVDSEGRSTKKINKDQLKHHHEETPRVPRNLRSQHQQPSEPTSATSSSSPPPAALSPISSPPPPAALSPPAVLSPLPSPPPPAALSAPVSLSAALSPPSAQSSPLAALSSPAALSTPASPLAALSPPSAQSSPLAALSPPSAQYSPLAALSPPFFSPAALSPPAVPSPPASLPVVLSAPASQSCPPTAVAPSPAQYSPPAALCSPAALSGPSFPSSPPVASSPLAALSPPSSSPFATFSPLLSAAHNSTCLPSSYDASTFKEKCM
ncbi:uncharacterized protein [Danio rerio]|uniref:Uncharacterized protein n=1 Tax=Danio rerio TaxID=7955 RepID=A0AC58J8N3_DANRE